MRAPAREAVPVSGERGPVAFIIARLEPVMHFCFGHNSRGVSVRRPGYDDAKE
jgi:hypothetical protein